MPNLPVSRYSSPARVAAPTTLSEVMLASRVNRAVQQTAASAHVRAVQARAEAAVSTAKTGQRRRSPERPPFPPPRSPTTPTPSRGVTRSSATELRHFENVFRGGAGEVLADLFSDYCQEGWR